MPHPESHCQAVTFLDVNIVRPRSDHLLLHYILGGNLGDLKLSPSEPPRRGEALWRHTCFEAFVRPVKGTGYYEFNFAPSLQWAAYQFTDYREGMRVVEEVSPSRLDAQRDDHKYQLTALLNLSALHDLTGTTGWHLSISAVIEETHGNTSYWALAHAPGAPDFHHSDCFVCTLAVEEQ